MSGRAAPGSVPLEAFEPEMFRGARPGPVRRPVPGLSDTTRTGAPPGPPVLVERVWISSVVPVSGTGQKASTARRASGSRTPQLMSSSVRSPGDLS